VILKLDFFPFFSKNHFFALSSRIVRALLLQKEVTGLLIFRRLIFRFKITLGVLRLLNLITYAEEEAVVATSILVAVLHSSNNFLASQ
jgi:hypothetical protein